MTIKNSLPYAGHGVNEHGRTVIPVGLAVGPSGHEVAQPVAGSGIPAGATLALTEAAHNVALILLNTLAGSVVTLPPSTGKGARYRFMVDALATSNSHVIKVANATDVMRGVIFSGDDTSDNAVAFKAGDTADTITLNRTTTGSVTVGEYIEIEDYKAGFFRVSGFISNTGTPATPFSATVS